MLRAERRRGLPDSDDDVDCVSYSRQAAALVAPGQVRLGRILDRDLTGAYGRIWARLRNDGHDGYADELFTRCVREALAARGPVAAGERRPQLLWQDAMPALRLPPGVGQRWTIEIGGTRRDIDGEARPLTITLPDAGVDSIGWRRTGRDAIGGEILLLPDRDDILVFAPEGRLIARGRLGDTAPLRLPRGPLTVVARRRIRDRQTEAEEAAVRGLTVLAVQLGDDPVEIGEGSVTLILAPTERPEVVVEGRWFSDIAGQRIHLVPAMLARVAWSGRDVADAAQAYALRLEFPDGRAVEQLIADPTQAAVPIGPEMARLPPGLRKIRVALVRAGEKRPLARSAALVWVGLTGFDGQRFRGSPPANLVFAEGAHADDVGVVIDAPETRPVATLSFADVDSRGRTETLAFPRPGASLRLVWFDPDGRRRTDPVAKGATVMVRPGDARLLEITCSDPTARLIVAGRDRSRRFIEKPVLSIALTTLAGLCSGAEPTVTLVGDDRVPVELLRLVLPAEVLVWRRTFNRERDEIVLHLGMPEAIAAVEIRGRDLWGGATFDLALVPDGLRRTDSATGAAARLATTLDAPHPAVALALERASWPPGLWLLDIDVRTDRDGGLVRPTNQRGDVFASLIDHDPQGHRTADLADADVERLLAVFARLHGELQRCYADQCWFGDLDLLGRLWRRLAGVFAARSGGPSWDRLLPLAFIDPPAETDGSWLPLLSLWHVFPDLLVQPAPAYAAIGDVARDDARVIAEVAAIGAAGSLSRYLFEQGRLAKDFYLRFGNVARVSTAAGILELADFDWHRYRSAVIDGIAADGPWWSVEDELLSAAHHLDAADALRRRYRRLVGGAGNGLRIQGASTIASAAARWADRQGRPALRPRLAAAERAGAALAIVPPAFEEEDAFLGNAIAGLSAIALACRIEVRRSGTYNRFLTELAADTDRERVIGSLHFLAFTGRETLALYLLLWEAILMTGDPCKT